MNSDMGQSHCALPVNVSVYLHNVYHTDVYSSIIYSPMFAVTKFISAIKMGVKHQD